MGRLRKAEAEAIAALEQAVLSGTPDEAARLCGNFGSSIFTAHILGLAGHFRGLDMVKALVENGASFRLGATGKDAVRALIPRVLDNELATYLPDFFILFLLKYPERTLQYILTEYLDELMEQQENPLQPVSGEELTAVVEYLCDNAQKACFCPGDLLYYAILTDDTDMTAAIKRKGVTLSDEKCKMLTEGGGGGQWFMYCDLISMVKDGDFVRIMTTLIDEINAAGQTGDALSAPPDKKLHFTEWFCDINRKRFFSPELLPFFLEHFNQSKMNKTKLMKRMIEDENTACLAVAASAGWLKTPRKRDEMIQYAMGSQKQECTAYLLEYKNRTADFAAEADKAEKKLMRELNANPNSLTQLKKNWSFQKKRDGTLMITGYKGRSTVLSIPEQIGENKVTEIEDWALSDAAPRIKEETREFRMTITKITVPGSVRVIGENAFRGLVSLQELVIQPGVKKIGENAFTDCWQLKSVVIPEGVTVLEANVFSCKEYLSELESVVLPRTLDIFSEKRKSFPPAPHLFWNCPKLTVRIPPMPKAIAYCEEHQLKYECYDIRKIRK